MILWRPGLTGNRRPARSPKTHPEEWVEVPIVSFDEHEPKVVVLFKGRKRRVWLEHTYYGACSFCGGPVRGDQMRRATAPGAGLVFCSPDCRDAKETRDALA